MMAWTFGRWTWAGFSAFEALDGLQRPLDTLEEVRVALQERRWLGLVGRPEQLREVGQRQPEIPEGLDGAVPSDPRRQQHAVQATSARAADHIDHGLDAGEVGQRPIGRVVQATEPVQLVGDAAHPHAQADAAGHHQADPQLRAILRARRVRRWRLGLRCHLRPPFGTWSAS